MSACLGNENVEVFPNIPRKKSKFKDRNPSLQVNQVSRLLTVK